MRLTKTERLLLANQYEILARLNPDFESSYCAKREVVLRGFELEMNSLFHTFDEEGLSVDGCSEVINILAMYEHLDGSFQRLEDTSAIRPAIFSSQAFLKTPKGGNFPIPTILCETIDLCIYIGAMGGLQNRCCPFIEQCSGFGNR